MCVITSNRIDIFYVIGTITERGGNLARCSEIIELHPVGGVVVALV